MYDTTYALDHARQYLTSLLPAQAERIEQASDRSIKASVDSAYDGGWDAFLAHHNGR
jgi:hypothetical protein